MRAAAFFWINANNPLPWQKLLPRGSAPPRSIRANTNATLNLGTLGTPKQTSAPPDPTRGIRASVYFIFNFRRSNTARTRRYTSAGKHANHTLVQEGEEQQAEAMASENAAVQNGPILENKFARRAAPQVSTAGGGVRAP